MTIHHLFDREDVYVITTNHKDDGEVGRGPHGGAHLYSPKLDASVEWSLLPRHGFGLAVMVGRNGTESDIGLDLHAFRLGSVWLRLRSPWTQWARITDRDREGWYGARHYGFQAFQGSWRWLAIHLGTWNGMGAKNRWRERTINTRTFLGLNHTETVEGMTGTTVVPMPEGDYEANWREVTHTTTYTAPLGKLRDRISGPRVHHYINIKIPGGIPVEGKGENSWDCGMDGVMGTSGPTVQAAVRNAVDAALRDRKRYGGPNELPHAMTIQEASRHIYGAEDQ